MAATGKTPILLYGSTTATNTPSAGNLTNSSDGCEIAINVADKNLFFKDSTNVVNTVPIRQSSASSNGWLSSTDWSTFNSKQPAGTYVTSVTGTAPVVSSGGTTPAISMAAATSSVNGYLTSTDWSTFNGKQAALVSGTNIKTVNGTSLLGSGDLGTIGTGYGGTGLTSFTANGLVYASSTSALTTGSSLTYASSTLTTPLLSVSSASAYAAISSTTAGNARYLLLNNPADSNSAYVYCAGYGMGLVQADANASSYVYISTQNTERMRIFGSGGVSIGNTTDPGATNLSVTGNIISGSSSAYASDTRISITPSSGAAAIGLKGVSGSGAYIYFNDTDVSAVQSRIGHVTNINVFEVRVGTTGGVYVANGGTSWSAISDERQKDIIEPITNAIEKVTTLRTVIGKYKNDNEDVRRAFLIAQDVQNVLPEAVNIQNDLQGTLGLAYTDVIPLLVAAIKELKQEIDTLKGN